VELIGGLDHDIGRTGDQIVGLEQPVNRGLGHKVLAFNFSGAIRQFPEVLDCYVLMGTVDFMLRIVTTDIEAYERFFFEKLSKVPGIQDVNSVVALSEIKSTTQLPLSLATWQPDAG